MFMVLCKPQKNKITTRRKPSFWQQTGMGCPDQSKRSQWMGSVTHIEVAPPCLWVLNRNLLNLPLKYEVRASLKGSQETREDTIISSANTADTICCQQACERTKWVAQLHRHRRPPWLEEASFLFRSPTFKEDGVPRMVMGWVEASLPGTRVGRALYWGVGEGGPAGSRASLPNSCSSSSSSLVSPLLYTNVPHTSTANLRRHRIGVVCAYMHQCCVCQSLYDEAFFLWHKCTG